MTFDVNEVVVRGLIPALHLAGERWVAAGAPCPSEQQRESIRAFLKAEKPDVGRARETYRYLTHWTEEALLETARIAQNEAQAKRRAARAKLHATMADELHEIREERMHISQNEMALLLRETYHAVHEAERDAGGSMSTDRLRHMLDRYRVLAKLYGAASTPKAQPKSQQLH